MPSSGEVPGMARRSSGDLEFKCLLFRITSILVVGMPFRLVSQFRSVGWGVVDKCSTAD